MRKIILASGSPRRKELLELASVPFEIIVSEVEETIGAYSSPSDIVMSLALQKASAVAENNSDHIVLGADTIVTYESRILESHLMRLRRKKCCNYYQENT